MQIGNRVDGTYGILYQKNYKTAQESAQTKEGNEYSMQDVNRMDILGTGEENESFQIGAQSFTDKEWDDFLKKFDSIQETVKEQMKEHQDKLKKEKLEKEKLNKEKLDKEKRKDLLEDEQMKKQTISESKSYSYPTDNSDGEVVLQVTAYTEKNDFYKRTKQIEKYEWSVPFVEKE